MKHTSRAGTMSWRKGQHKEDHAWSLDLWVILLIISFLIYFDMFSFVFFFYLFVDKFFVNFYIKKYQEDNKIP